MDRPVEPQHPNDDSVTPECTSHPPTIYSIVAMNCDTPAQVTACAREMMRREAMAATFKRRIGEVNGNTDSDHECDTGSNSDLCPTAVKICHVQPAHYGHIAPGGATGTVQTTWPPMSHVIVMSLPSQHRGS